MTGNTAPSVHQEMNHWCSTGHHSMQPEQPCCLTWSVVCPEVAMPWTTTCWIQGSLYLMTQKLYCKRSELSGFFFQKWAALSLIFMFLMLAYWKASNPQKGCNPVQPASSYWQSDSHHLGFQERKFGYFWSLRKLSFSPSLLPQHTHISLYVFP